MEKGNHSIEKKWVSSDSESGMMFKHNYKMQSHYWHNGSRQHQFWWAKQQKSWWDLERYNIHDLRPLQGTSVQPCWFLYGLQGWMSTMIILESNKKNCFCVTVDQKYEIEKLKINQQTYYVYTQSKIILSGTSGKVEYYNNAWSIVILFHPP